ncbi:MAG TPA: 30S ribosomal protein S8 [Trueperaceae bacterium]|nr:30S ribosomal protein S8 [Trueperaceae bacterium]
MLTDPIADMLTRIRNAAAIANPNVDVPASKFKKAVADVLVKEGYIKSVDSVEVDGKPFLRVGLKYGPRRKSIINKITRISRPGRRYYVKSDAIPVVRGGLGIALISTSKGILVDRDARRQNIGGEVICEVW